MIRIGNTGTTKISTLVKGVGDVGFTQTSTFTQKSFSTLNSRYSTTLTNYVRTDGIQILEDESIIIVGQFQYFGNKRVNGIVMLDKFGRRVSTFNISSGSEVGFGDGNFSTFQAFRTVFKTWDNKLLIADAKGFYWRGIDRGKIVKLNRNGEFEFGISSSYFSGSTVGDPLVSNGISHAIETSTRKILVTGQFNGFSGSFAPGIMLLNADGTRDTTWNPAAWGSAQSTQTFTLEETIDGKFLLKGSLVFSYNGQLSGGATRILSNGGLDTTFGGGSRHNSIPTNLYSEPNTKIISVGNQSTYNGVSSRRITRINSNGTLDTTFNTGSSFNAVPDDVVRQRDGKYVVVGPFTTYSGSSALGIVRLQISGSVDNTFVSGNGFFSSGPSFVKKQADEKLICFGNFEIYSASLDIIQVGKYDGILRLNTSGSIDTTFEPDGGGFRILNTSTYQSFVTQSDGKIVFVGDFDRYGTNKSRYVARINYDGTFDNTLNTATTGSAFNNITYDVIQTSDSKLIIGGSFTQYSGSTQTRLVRILPSGAIDNDFNFGTAPDGDVFSLCEQNDNKILVGGAFTTISGSTYQRIVRLNVSGTIDTGFSISGGLNNTPNVIRQTSDSKIVIGGSFTIYSGSTANRIVRTNLSASIDATFSTGTGFNGEVFSITEQSDKKLIVGGNFTTYNGTTRNYIARLNASGSLDTTFVVGTGFDNSVYTTFIQSDNKIICGGNFTSYSSSLNRPRIVRLNPSGSVDTSFNIGDGFNGTVYDIKQLSNGNILVYGGFSYYSGSDVSNIVELTISGSIAGSFS